MRPATYYYLARAWPADRHRGARQGAPSRATRRGRHARPARRDRYGRELSALARRVLAVLSGTSQTA
jgi:hypothetical protein